MLQFLKMRSRMASMQKFLKILCQVSLGLVVFVILIIVTLVLSVTHYRELPYKNTTIPVKYMDEEMGQFIKNSYNFNGQRAVLYAPEIFQSTCPYNAQFAASVRKERSNPRWTGIYNFYPQPRSYNGNTPRELKKNKKLLIEFMEHICDVSCIVDPNENWVYDIERPTAVYDALEYFNDN